MDAEPGPPIDLRRVRYFVAVAEELHFGHAAARLYVAQSVLSRQVRKLELELGVNLLARGSRSVELTEAGQRMLEEGRALLLAAGTARRHVQKVAAGAARLTIGFWVSDVLAPAVRRFSTEWPGVDVDLIRVYWHDQRAVLHDGRADVALLHGPVDDPELEVLPIRMESRVAALAADSPLACRTTVDITELSAFPVVRHEGADAAWDAFERVDPRPDGSHPLYGPGVHNVEEKLAHVASSTAIGFLPAFTAATITHEGVVFIPVTGIPPSQISVAWSAAHDSPLIRTFVAAVCDQPTDRGHCTRQAPQTS